LNPPALGETDIPPEGGKLGKTWQSQQEIPRNPPRLEETDIPLRVINGGRLGTPKYTVSHDPQVD
jgi:hypothetical protein